jgi:hypothetical protein
MHHMLGMGIGRLILGQSACGGESGGRADRGDEFAAFHERASFARESFALTGVGRRMFNPIFVDATVVSLRGRQALAI